MTRNQQQAPRTENPRREAAFAALERARLERAACDEQLAEFATLKRDATFAAVQAGRDAGMTWKDIAEALGISHPSAIQLHQRVTAERALHGEPAGCGSHE